MREAKKKKKKKAVAWIKPTALRLQILLYVHFLQFDLVSGLKLYNHTSKSIIDSKTMRILPKVSEVPTVDDLILRHHKNSGSLGPKHVYFVDLFLNIDFYVHVSLLVCIVTKWKPGAQEARRGHWIPWNCT